MVKNIEYKYVLTLKERFEVGCLHKNKSYYGIIDHNFIDYYFSDQSHLCQYDAYDLHVVSNESLQIDNYSIVLGYIDKVKDVKEHATSITFEKHSLMFDKQKFPKIVASTNTELNVLKIDFKSLNHFIDYPNSEIEDIKIEFTNDFKSFDKIPDRYLVDNFSNYKWVLKVLHKREIPFVPKQDRTNLSNCEVSVQHILKTIENLSIEQKFEILRTLMQSEFFTKQYKVIQEFCDIASKIGEKFEHKHAHDCFCGGKPFDSNFKFDDVLLEIIKRTFNKLNYENN